MTKLLIIAWTFPPMPYAGTYRTLRFCKYLSEIGYDITVIAPRVFPTLPADNALLKGLDDKIRIIRTASPDLDIWYRNIHPKLQGNILGKVVNKILTNVLRLINQPDHMVFWQPFALYHAYKQIKERQIKFFYTTAPPFSTHLTGYFLKKLTNANWIADFRDPIKGNIAQEYWNNLTRVTHFRIEEMVVAKADDVLTTTETTRDQFADRYRMSKFHAIYNSVDDADVQNDVVERYDRFTISHLGSIYMFRRADVLFKAMKKLEQDQKIDPDNFCVQFVGRNDAYLINSIKEHELEGFVRLHDMVSHKEAMDIMQKSDLLLLIKGFGSRSQGQIPGKLFEYLGTRNNIILIGPKDSEAAQILDQAKAGIVVEDDADELAEWIYTEMKGQRCSAVADNEDRNKAVARFSASSMAARLDELIRSKS